MVPSFGYLWGSHPTAETPPTPTEAPSPVAQLTGTETRSVSRYEITAVYTHPDAKVDIVLVHGLNGQPGKTWTAKNGVFWPIDLLPASLKDVHANVLVYGYNADVYSNSNDKSASDNFIHQHAQTLITTLTLYRRSVGTFRNPIIWVAHSLGGILVKRALLYSNDLRAAHHNDYRSIYVSTFGIIFLGTPHVGSDGATWGLMLQAMSDAIILKKLFETESVLLRTLKKDNETLANINSHFLDIYQRFRIHMAHENHKTDIKGTKVIIVDANSASPQLPGVTYYGIEATHSGMCKFDGPNAPGFRNVSTDIRQWIIDAPALIQVRWEVEEEERRARLSREATELYGTPYVSQGASQPYGYADAEPLTRMKDQTGSLPVILPPYKPSTVHAPMLRSVEQPLFIHPEGFRPNAYFKGREKELEELHRILMNKHRRDQGTSAALIWSVPGGGKSCLVREYAFRHMQDYPGGIFWIRGKMDEDLEDGFLKMAKCSSIWADIWEEGEIDLHSPTSAIPLVRDWLNRTEDWLLIFDGVLHDTPGLSKYIPDARNTSMIFTSTDSSIAGDHKFDAPRKITLGPLPEDDAQIMLLEEMDKAKPWSQDDLNRALEAVRLMGCLPLAVHAAAKQLRATREPLSKYVRSYKARPRAGGLGAYKGVREKLQERGEIAALNLMYLLSFFTARVPVELVALGLQALDKRTPVRTCDSMGKGSLNKTFTVLIAFALIERDEVADVPSASSMSPESSYKEGRSAELVDVLKIHCVVQTFFRETLSRENQFDFWLERAAAVLCRSFDEGNARAGDNPDVGLPDDYRRYAAECRKILDHISQVDQPTAELRAAKLALQRRLGDIQGCRSTLASTMTTDALEEGGKGPHVSIFDRTNSLSLSRNSSLATADTTNDGTLGVADSGLGPLGCADQPPSLATLEQSPHLYHVPYPQQETIPGPPEFCFYEDRGNGLESSPRRELVTHRTVRRRDTTRYHDRAGAWRETRLKVTEPRARVSISKEVARGQFSPVTSAPPQSAGSRSGTPISVLTDAGRHLATIRSTSQRVPDGHEQIQKAGVACERSTLDDNSSYERNVRTGRPRGYSSPLMTRPQLRTNGHTGSRKLLDEVLVFDESSFGSASVPSFQLDDSTWRPASQDEPSGFPKSPSESCLEADIGQWAPRGLPVVVSSTSTLSPTVYSHAALSSHQRSSDSDYTCEGLSTSLPSDASTLHPHRWHLSSSSSLQPDGYTSQPLSRNPSSNIDLPTEQLRGSTRRSRMSSNLPVQTRRCPSTARTEPSPRIRDGFDAVPTSYQAWQQRHRAGPWSEAVERSSVPRDSSPHGTTSDAVEMERSGSGGIQFNGRIVQFGTSLFE